jgi:sugar phosphate permease
VVNLANSAREAIRARRKSGVFYGWWIVAVGVVTNMLLTGVMMQAYGAYVVMLREQFGWSRTALGAGFSVMRAEIGLLGPLEGWLIDRFGPRTIVRVGLVLFGVGLMLFSQVQTLWMFYIAIFIVAVGAALGGFLPFTVTVVNWFDRRRSTALGILLTGFAAGALVVPLVAWSMETFGWRTTAFTSGVVVLAVTFPLTWLIRTRPEDYGYLPDGDPPRATATSFGESGMTELERTEVRDFTAREALRTPAFWHLAIGHGSALLIVAALTVHLIAHLTESRDFTVAQAAMVVLFLTVIQITGQLSGGMLGDRFDKRMVVVGCMVLHAVGLLVLAYASALWMVILFAVLHGIGWGVRGPLMASMRAEYFGRSSFGTIMGFSTLISTVGMITGPLLAGILYDVQGTYTLGFTVLAAMALLGGTSFLLARKPDRPTG